MRFRLSVALAVFVAASVALAGEKKEAEKPSKPAVSADQQKLDHKTLLEKIEQEDKELFLDPMNDDGKVISARFEKYSALVHTEEDGKLLQAARNRSFDRALQRSDKRLEALYKKRDESAKRTEELIKKRDAVDKQLEELNKKRGDTPNKKP